MKRSRYPFIVTLLIITGILSSCYYDKEALLYPDSGNIDCSSVTAGFAAQVFPLMQTKCAIAGCHDAASASGGMVFTNYTTIKAAANRINQRAVVEKTMPAGNPLSTAETALLKCWIQSGAPNN